jgi:two-component system probable response regulator PhcQ
MMRRIMLVDDEVNVLSALQRAMRAFLPPELAEVEVYSDPETALLRCAAVPFDVVISDYGMPGLSGADFLQMVKGIQPMAVRLMLSASTDFAQVSDAINRAEVFRYVAKPWNSADLERTVRHAFERRDSLVVVAPGAPLSLQELEARKLEHDEPGITWVRRDALGAVYLDE